MASTATSSTAVSGDSSRAQAEARAAVQASLESDGSAYDAKYQRRATDLHANARAISKQEDQLKKNAAALAKESDKWQKELDKATKGLNEFGDLQNWAEMMERDFLVLEETLRLVEGTDAVESASGGSRRRPHGRLTQVPSVQKQPSELDGSKASLLGSQVYPSHSASRKRK
ncbi:hypothetical protein LTR91_007527 [Friedmanniomyces endolithicus]|uniref:Biogenesis of lysosome-related organelles complex 1 subunit 1 n=1 Tax=Friedmanniomyces endolithicus TaxID=329885 RepID=A0AAN6KP64_9PEZI|nr:hypothetical protein LTR94_006295 [Friedmanniomyces endolithicus]KAK0768839.1 hypothetical protein LTR59_017388 [Friedmanniomyces endolithicus]KAK0770386.1 hypothetical protein LTR75_017924 [Friedmanniomyces endolithicus]KAK0820315.1 hypothetical protein LTR38_000224 [Friedmanniomyces endolithicus]KAK0828821.1 hypothetical protein LTR03_016390 [Friedmanniomyces endolithicus]